MEIAPSTITKAIKTTVMATTFSWLISDLRTIEISTERFAINTNVKAMVRSSEPDESFTSSILSITIKDKANSIIRDISIHARLLESAKTTRAAPTPLAAGRIVSVRISS